MRLANGTLRRADRGASDPLAIESAARFNSQIPLEYAYAAWDALPEDDTEDARLLEPYRHATTDLLVAFASHQLRALAHI